jgi:hypothetical protein
MARMVVLLIPDNEEAQKLVEVFNEGGVGLTRKDEWVEDASSCRGEVVGLYAMPTMFCECLDHSGAMAKYKVGFGAKFGWRVCRTCNKAIIGYQIARNLLPEDKRPRGFKNAALSFSTFKDKLAERTGHSMSLWSGRKQ